MRGKLWLFPVVLAGVGILGCATKTEVKIVDDRLTKVNADVKVWADSVVLYLDALHGAVCKLANKTNTILPDQQRTACAPGGGGDVIPPPKYPPR